MKKVLETREEQMSYFRNCQDFDILFCRGNGFVSSLIIWFTKGFYSHMALVVVIDNVVYIAEAQKNGFQLKTPDVWIEKYNYKFTVVRKRVINGGLQKMKEKRLIMLGTRYDFYSFVVSFPRQKWIRFVNKFRKYKIEDQPSIKESKTMKKVFCSEAILLIFGLLKSMLSPNEAFNYMLSFDFDVIEFD